MEFGNTILTSKPSDPTTRLRYLGIPATFKYEHSETSRRYELKPDGDDSLKYSVMIGDDRTLAEKRNPGVKA